MRVSDAEREQLVEQLREHFAAGRLTLDELTQRTEQAYQAVTEEDLAVLVDDLPSDNLPVLAAQGPAPLAQRARSDEELDHRGAFTMRLGRKKAVVAAAGALATVLFFVGVFNGIWWSWLAFIALPGVANALMFGNDDAEQ